MKKIVAVLICFFILLSIVGCKSKSNAEESAPIPENIDTTYTPDNSEAPQQIKVGSENVEYSTKILLKGDLVESVGNGATVKGSTVTVTKSGEYLLEGSVDNGQLIVDTPDDSKVTLYLNGVSVTNKTGPAVYVRSATKKVVIYSTENSVNLFCDGESYTDTETDGAIYSKEDLTFEGKGSIYVTALHSDGIVSKDSIEILSGNISVNSADDGIRGKDDVTVKDGKVVIASVGDGIKATNETDEGEGNVYINGGTVEIKASLDGIQAVTSLEISEGTVKIQSGEGSTNSSDKSSQEGNWGQWGHKDRGPKGPQDNSFTVSTVDDIPSAKGIKCEKNIVISGGTITLDSSDDAIHSNNDVTVKGGVIGISSGDDGIHADNNLTIDGGNIKIDKSYEGLEATEIYVNGGTAEVISSDDGINAAGGNDSSAISGRPGQNMFTSGNGKIIINGGNIILDASGDGIDSNGSVNMSGGKVTVFGPENNGNGSLDYDKDFTVSGGTLLAVGSSGMAQGVSSSGQGSLITRINNISAGSSVSVKSGDTEILSFTAEKNFSHLIFTDESIKKGSSYTIYVNSQKLGSLTAK